MPLLSKSHLPFNWSVFVVPSLIVIDSLKGPTLFPIMFAAISGRSMKMIARFLAEKGTKLSVSNYSIILREKRPLKVSYRHSSCSWLANPFGEQLRVSS